MTTPAKQEEEIIPLFNIEMKAMISDFMGKFQWTIVGGPYEKRQADEYLNYLEENFSHREYRLTRADV
jgi:hypothetical protein